jgi:hypothetical protein
MPFSVIDDLGRHAFFAASATAFNISFFRLFDLIAFFEEVQQFHSS